MNAIPDLKTWHYRLRHANYQAIMQMACTGMIKGMLKTFCSKPPKCDHCILGKQTHTPVPRIREEGEGHRASRRLAKIWVDLTGQAVVTSRTGNVYVMNIMDDYTNKPWSIPLKTKDEGFSKLQAWIQACKNETGLKLKVLLTGRDSKFNGEKHKKWYRSKDIILEVSAPHTSAHIGCIEQMHCTLMGKARSMRLAAQCPPFLWDEFYLMATHVHGRTKTLAINYVTPDELWYGKKPDYSYF